MNYYYYINYMNIKFKFDIMYTSFLLDEFRRKRLNFFGLNETNDKADLKNLVD